MPKRYNKLSRKTTLWNIYFGGKATSGRCIYCKKHISFNEATIEHLKPLSCGGRSSIHSGNLFFACLQCNRIVGNHFKALASIKNILHWLKANAFDVYQSVIYYRSLLQCKQLH